MIQLEILGLLCQIKLIFVYLVIFFYPESSVSSSIVRVLWVYYSSWYMYVLCYTMKFSWFRIFWFINSMVFRVVLEVLWLLVSIYWVCFYFVLGREGMYLRYCVHLLERCYSKILMIFFFLDYWVYTKPLLWFKWLLSLFSIYIWTLWLKVHVFVCSLEC